MERRCPSSLQSLTLGAHFNQHMLCLPTHLRSLTFGDHFNQPLDRVILPQNLGNLTFGACFRQKQSSKPDFGPAVQSGLGRPDAAKKH